VRTGLASGAWVQLDIVAECMRTTAQFKRIILVAPTGAGKTVIAVAIIKDESANAKKSSRPSP
jgi:superfamily II DNA or RNA helicase